MPKVSVIIPVYNVEKYLRKCLDSVVGQTLKDIEIICVDDGSTDGSGKILDEYAQKDERIKVIHQKNQGGAVARNRAIEASTGQYLAFCDSDDWLDKNFYECLYNHSENGKIDVIKGNTKRVYDTKTEISNLNDSIRKGKKHIVALFTHEWQSAIYKRDLLVDNKLYFKKALLAEDQNFLCHLLCCVKTYTIVDDVYYYYFQNPASLTHKITPQHIYDLCRMDREIINTLQSHKISKEDQATIMCDRIMYLLRYKDYCRQNNLQAFFEENIFDFIRYLNSLNSSISKFSTIKSIEDFRQYLNCQEFSGYIKKYKLFGFIPLLKIEEKKNFNTENQADLRMPNADFDNFLYHDIRPNSVLMVEFNSFHGECLPGMAKYFIDLGYNVDVCLDPTELDIEPFADFNSDKIRLFRTSKATLKRIITNDVVEKYAHVYINSDQTYDHGLASVFDYIGSNIKFPEGKIVTMCHHAEKFEELEPKSDKFAVVTLNNLPILEGRNYAMVNAHYFGDFKRTTKNNVVNFICVGIIESARKNHSLLFDAVDYLLQRGINNFKITIVARGGNLRIPQHIRPYLDFKGRLSYKDMYTELKKADFYLPLFDVENHDHERYLTCGSSGSYQLIYGFKLPCIIPHKFQTKVNGFNNENSLGYEQNADLGSAMKTAIEMTEKQYKEKVVAIEKLSAEIYATSAENMKKILQAAENKYANNYFISLGENCFNRTVLTRHHLKSKREQGEKSYPFDLCVCSFSSMKQLIENDFADYFNDLVWNDKDQLWINSKYDIRYNHDQDCARNNKEKLVERYQRRINNFREIMRDGHEHVFVFSSIRKDVSFEEICRLQKFLQKNCSGKIKFIYINIGKEDLNYKYESEQCSVFYKHIPNPYPNYWGEWYKYEYFNSDKGIKFEKAFIEFVENCLNKEYRKCA